MEHPRFFSRLVEWIYCFQYDHGIWKNTTASKLLCLSVINNTIWFTFYVHFEANNIHDAL